MEENTLISNKKIVGLWATGVALGCSVGFVGNMYLFSQVQAMPSDEQVTSLQKENEELRMKLQAEHPPVDRSDLLSGNVKETGDGYIVIEIESPTVELSLEPGQEWPVEDRMVRIEKDTTVTEAYSEISVEGVPETQQRPLDVGSIVVGDYVIVTAGEDILEKKEFAAITIERALDPELN